MKEEVKLCRDLRKRQTETERKLWSVLRNRQLCGMKFRRQYAIDRYVVDFYSEAVLQSMYCPEYKIAIEADGGQHYDVKNIERDRIRTKIINQHGIKVLRFSDADILTKAEAVCEHILAEAGVISNTRVNHV